MEIQAEIRRQIIDLVNTIERAECSDVEGAIDAASDYLCIGENRADDLVVDSILDGLRWGFREAGVAEKARGTVLRIRAPGGICITHEWVDSPSPAQIASVMASVEQACGGSAG